jgi:hypothetical protein
LGEFVGVSCKAIGFRIVFVHFTGRDPSWIIIFVTFLPDLDEVRKNIEAVVSPIGIWQCTFFSLLKSESM